MKCFIAISRKTIGWHKMTDRISYSQLSEITGLSVNSLKKGIHELIENYYIKQTDSKFGYKYDLAISENDTGVSKNDTEVSNSDIEVSKIDNTKETNNKKTNKKETNIYKFQKPTLQEVNEYCYKRKNNIDPEQFINHYDANGWMRGKTKIRDWKACIRTWERNNFSKPRYNKDQQNAETFHEVRSMTSHLITE
jgi:phage replication O-like protein O